MFGLLIGPPATAIILVREGGHGQAVSAVCAVFAVVTGLLISYHYSTAASATIVLISVVMFFLVLTGSRLREIQRRKGRVPVSG